MNRNGPPAGFLSFRTPRACGWVREGFAQLVDRAGDLRAGRACGEPGHDAAYRGRAAMARVPLGAAGPPYGLVRHYRRGGLLQGLLRDGYLGKGRFFREVVVTERARALGVATVEILAVRVQRVVPGVYRGDLVTREIEKSRDLQAVLERFAGGTGAGDRGERDRAVSRVAGLVRHMHDVGLFHADLNLKNVLVRGESEALECFVIDLDKSRIHDGPLGRRRRMKNLLRLYRSTEKRGFAGSAVTLRDMMRFAKVYSGGDRELLAACRNGMRRAPLTLRVRRFFWRVFRGRSVPFRRPQRRWNR